MVHSLRAAVAEAADTATSTCGSRSSDVLKKLRDGKMVLARLDLHAGGDCMGLSSQCLSSTFCAMQLARLIAWR